MRDVTAICEALAGWAKRWELSAPRLSAGWIDMPDAYKPLIRDGRVERPILEPPANAADEAAVVAATGGALPDDLRALHAVHDGTFAPRLPSGMSMAPYATTPTRWRSCPDLGDDDGARRGPGLPASRSRRGRSSRRYSRSSADARTSSGGSASGSPCCSAGTSAGRSRPTRRSWLARRGSHRCRSHVAACATTRAVC